MNTIHLSDEQIAEVVSGLASPAQTEHIERCPQCAAVTEHLNSSIARLREQIIASSERPAGFWALQRQAVSQRIAPRRSPALGIAWAANFALFLLAVLLLFNTPAPPPSDAKRIDPDDALLLSVNSALQSESPRALSPATLIAKEIQLHISSTSIPASRD